jgi:hypothetical protein
MSVYTYQKISSMAGTCYNNTKKKYANGIDNKWSYYISKAILNPKKDIKRIGVKDAPAPIEGDYISRTINKTDYLELIKDFVNFVEKKGRLPNFVYIGKLRVRLKLWTAFVSYILYKYNTNKKFPGYQNINSKIYIRPTETGNAVYDYFTQKTRKKFKTLDEILEYVAANFTYQFYFDDVKSNKQVSDTKSGNCTDLLQWLINMVTPLGYEWKCIHVQCRTSGTGHVFGKFRHKTNTGNKWITRDIACIADNHEFCVWCEDGYILAENPDWWLANLHR